MSLSSKTQSIVVRKTKKVPINEKKPQKKKFNKIEYFYKKPGKPQFDQSHNVIADEGVSVNQSLGSLMHTMDKSKIEMPKTRHSSNHFASLENLMEHMEAEKEQLKNDRAHLKMK